MRRREGTLRRAIPVALVTALGLGSGLGCGDETEPVPGFVHGTFYASLREARAGFVRQGGQWLDDYGDAAFYGLAYHAWSAERSGDASDAAVAEAARDSARQVLAEADLIRGDVNEIAMAALGLIEGMQARGDLDDLDVLDPLLDTLDDTVEILGWSLDGGVVQGYAVDTYGPTSIGGLVGLLNAQYAMLVEAPRREARIAWAGEMAEALEAEAWNGTFYDFGAGREGLFLYPNVTMMLLHLRLHQLTGDRAHQDRALALHQAIQPLRVETDGPGLLRYRSPYSAEHMGAQTDDYTTLSSQNYTLFALLLLYEVTGEARFLSDWNGIVSFLEARLFRTWCRSDVHTAPCEPACGAGEACVDGHCLPEACQPGVIHHWMDGAPAQPEHPEVFCSGCNLQLLFVMLYRQELLQTP